MKLVSYSASPIAVMAIRLWGAAAVIYGILVWIGGADRWSANMYATVNLVPGSPYTWGVVVFAGGVLILFGSLRGHRALRNVGMYVMAGWCWLFGIAIGLTALQDTHTPYTAVVFLFTIACHVMVLARAKERPRDDATDR